MTDWIRRFAASQWPLACLVIAFTQIVFGELSILAKTRLIDQNFSQLHNNITNAKLRQQRFEPCQKNPSRPFQRYLKSYV